MVLSHSWVCCPMLCAERTGPVPWEVQSKGYSSKLSPTASASEVSV